MNEGEREGGKEGTNVHIALRVSPVADVLCTTA